MLRRKRVRAVAAASIAVALAVMAIKYWAYAVTGSVALFSDALESIVNVITACMALWAVSYAAKPADADHQFGHHKAEYFSAVAEGVLIVVAALIIFNEAYQALRYPRELTEPAEGMAINAAASVLNAAWSFVLIRLGRSWRSPALLADGRHLMTDVMTSIGVLAGLALAIWTGWNLLDPVLALAVAANILYQGWRVMRASFAGLMDQAPPPDIANTIRDMISANADGALEVHDLKIRLAGQAIFVEFHMVVPGQMTVAESHTICDRVEDALEEAMDGVRVVIHVEPEDMAKQQGVPVL